MEREAMTGGPKIVQVIEMGGHYFDQEGRQLDGQPKQERELVRRLQFDLGRTQKLLWMMLRKTEGFMVTPGLLQEIPADAEIVHKVRNAEDGTEFLEVTAETADARSADDARTTMRDGVLGVG